MKYLITESQESNLILQYVDRYLKSDAVKIRKTQNYFVVDVESPSYFEEFGFDKSDATRIKNFLKKNGFVSTGVGEYVKKMVNENKLGIKDLLIKQISDKGLMSTSKITGIHPNQIISTVGDDVVTTDIKINFIKDVINEVGGIVLTEIGEEPIPYGRNDSTIGVIDFLGFSSVLVDVFNHDMDKHMGEFRIYYINLSDDIIERIYSIVIEVFNENID